MLPLRRPRLTRDLSQPVSSAVEILPEQDQIVGHDPWMPGWAAPAITSRMPGSTLARPRRLLVTVRVVLESVFAP